jgi:hypothetical protein
VPDRALDCGGVPFRVGSSARRGVRHFSVVSVVLSVAITLVYILDFLKVIFDAKKMLDCDIKSLFTRWVSFKRIISCSTRCVLTLVVCKSRILCLRLRFTWYEAYKHGVQKQFRY